MNIFIFLATLHKVCIFHRFYKYGSGNSNVTSRPVSFLYTDANVST